MSVIQKLTTRRKAAAKASQDTQKALHELRHMSARLRDERVQIEGRPVPLEAAQKAAAEGLLAEADRIMAELDLAPLTKPANGREPYLHLPPERRADFAFVAGVDAIAQAVSARVADHYAAQGLTGIAADDRAAALAKIDGELLACELAEEAVVRELEREGVAPLRRADADPRATLAADTELK